MVQFLSNFFPWISSIFVGFFKSSRFFCVTLYTALVKEHKYREKKATNLSPQTHATHECNNIAMTLYTGHGYYDLLNRSNTMLLLLYPTCVPTDALKINTGV